MAAQFTHKRGDRFSHRCTWRNGAGAAVTLGAAPRAQLRDKNDALVQELSVSLEPQSGGTLGSFVVRVNYQQPVQAITVATGSSSQVLQLLKNLIGLSA